MAPLWIPDHIETRDKMEEAGFYSDRMSVQEMMDMLPDHIDKYAPREFYQIKNQDPSRELDYIIIPKNGATYFEFRLGIEGHGPWWRSRLGAATFKQRMPFQDTNPMPDPDNHPGRGWDSNSKVVLIREPVSRAISSYQHLVRVPTVPVTSGYGSLSSFITIKMDFWKKVFNPQYEEAPKPQRRAIDPGWNQLIIDPAESAMDIVESFVLFLIELKHYGFYNKHAFPQTKFISDLGLSIEDIDYVILHEELKEGVEKLAELFDLPIVSHELGYEKRNPGNTQRREILNKVVSENNEIKDMIYELYAPDFELYERVKRENRFYS